MTELPKKKKIKKKWHNQQLKPMIKKSDKKKYFVIFAIIVIVKSPEAFIVTIKMSHKKNELHLLFHWNLTVPHTFHVTVCLFFLY